MNKLGEPRIRQFLIVICLAAITFALFAPVARHGFVNFDDELYVYDNPHVLTGLSWANLRWAFTTGHASNWHPLTWLSHMLDVQLFGVHPGAHHLVNVAFHAANSILLFLLFVRLTATIWRSAFVAALFAVHPLHVESVAWASERKDVLSALFWLLATIAYARFVEERSLRRYALLLLLFAFGLLAKPMLVTLPCVFLLLDYWPLRRFNLSSVPKQAILEKLPLLLLAAASSVVTFCVQSSAGAVSRLDLLPLSARVPNALLSYVCYLSKAIVPVDLVVFYPLRRHVPSWQTISAILLLVGITGAVVLLRRRAYLPVGWFWYLGTLVPVIGIVQVGAQAMADRYTYIPLIGIFIILAWGAADFVEWWPRLRVSIVSLAMVSLLALSACTAHQLTYWIDTLTLFRHGLRIFPDDAVGQNAVGVALKESGRIADARAHFIEALRLQPRSVEPHNNLGNILLAEGNVGEALAHYSEAARVDPRSQETCYNLGVALFSQQKYAEAAGEFSKALRLGDPKPEIENNLAGALQLQGKSADAIPHYEAALRLSPNLLSALKNLGWLRAASSDPALRDPAEALRLARRACEVTENRDPIMLDLLAAALAANGGFTDAVRTAERARALARAANHPRLADSITAHMTRYERGEPWVQPLSSTAR